MKEAQYINKSLSALGDVMEALDQKSKHIPYRCHSAIIFIRTSRACAQKFETDVPTARLTRR
jgi:hypothetical protein